MTTETMQYRIEGMTCGHCERAVRAQVERLVGIERVEVSAREGTLVLARAAGLDEAEVVHAVREAGYAAVRVR